MFSSLEPSYYALTGGKRFAQGRACSSCEASLKRVASSPYLPTKCVPMGRPSLFQKSGTDIAGCPVVLEIGVNGTKVEAMPLARGSSGVETNEPSGSGGEPSVGVSRTSYLFMNSAICLAISWKYCTAIK